MVKIGGQEARVTGGTAYMLQLSEPYLGASIIPNHLLDGSKLYTGGCSVISNANSVATQKAADMIGDTSLVVNNDHDCTHDGFTSAIYRRSDDPSNQNLYKTADTAVATDAIMTTRGSSDVYIVTGAAEGTGVKSFTIADSRFEISGSLSAAGEAAAAIFVNNHGPYTRASGTIATGDAAIVVDAASGGKALADFNNAEFTNAVYLMPLHISKAATVAISAGDILALNGPATRSRPAPP